MTFPVVHKVINHTTIKSAVILVDAQILKVTEKSKQSKIFQIELRFFAILRL